METNSLDVSAESTESMEPATRARPRWRTRKAVWLGGVLAATVALVATAIVVVPRITEPDTVRTVREFLTAARQRDPERAFEIAGYTDPLPSGDTARFLAADAMSDDWEIRSVEEEYQIADRAAVRVTIAGPDDSTASATMDLTRRGDRWRIVEPFVRISFAFGPFWYAEVNGVRTPTDVHPPDLEYPLFPGFYRFYGNPPAGVETRYPDLLALPGSGRLPYTWVQPEAVTLTAAGEQAVQQAVNAFIDDCVQSPEPAPGWCPFGTDPHTGPRLPDYGYLSDIGDFRWQVVEYPIVAAVPAQTGLAITDRRRGVVELRGTGHELYFADGETTDLGTVDFTVHCEMITSRLVAGLTAEGTVTVLSTYQQGEAPEEDTWDTCENPVQVVAVG